MIDDAQPSHDNGESPWYDPEEGTDIGPFTLKEQPELVDPKAIGAYVRFVRDQWIAQSEKSWEEAAQDALDDIYIYFLAHGWMEPDSPSPAPVSTSEAAERPAPNSRAGRAGKEPRMSARVGRTQGQVLTSLAASARSARTIARDWPGLTESAVRGAVNRLGMRGFVDVSGWDDYGCRTYCLTERGAALERKVHLDDEADEDE